MQISCTRRFRFEAAHRVMGHESKCAHIHGHSYRVFVTAVLPEKHKVDDLGRVIDFSVLKELIGTWIDTYLDHGIILYAKDDAGWATVQAFNEAMTSTQKSFAQKAYCMPYNPTAENIAVHLKMDIFPRLLEGTGVEISSVRVEETENCSAAVD